MAQDEHPYTPPEGAAREWLARERERQREWERLAPGPRPPKTQEEKDRELDWGVSGPFGLVLAAAGVGAWAALAVMPLVGWGLAAAVGAAAPYVYGRLDRRRGAGRQRRDDARSPL